MMSAKLSTATVFGVVLMLAASAGWAQQSNTAKPAPAAAPQVNAAFNAWDSDKNGVLSRSEFDAGWAVLRQTAVAEQRLRAQFHKVDANGNGAIDAGEYPNLLVVKNAGANAMPLSTFDTNKNQRLEFGEYVSLLRRMTARGPVAAPAKKLP
jgi:Ca2+-binding EF-hand superfamily protein